VKRRRSLRPETPFLAGGHSRTRVNRYRSRFVVTCVSTTTRPSAALPRTAPKRGALALPPEYGTFGSPSPVVVASRCSRETPARGSLDLTAAQRLLQLTSDARTHSRASDSRVSIAPAIPQEPTCSRFRRAPRSTNPSPLEEDHKSCEPRDPSEADPTALQARRKVRPRKPPSDRNAACGRRNSATIACGDGRWRTALDCAGRVALSEGPFVTPTAAAGRRARRRPSSTSFSSTHGGHRDFVRWAGCSRRPHEPIKGLRSDVAPRRATLS